MEGEQAFPVEGVVNHAANPPRAHQPAAPQHAKVPAQAGLADSDRIGELEHGDLGNTGEVLEDAKTGDAGQCLVVGSELAKGRIREERSRCHIKNPLWIIAAAWPTPSSLSAVLFPSPACGGGSGRGLAQQVPGQAHANSQSVL